MAQVIISINYREYAISCENGEEGRIIKLGRLLDEKAKALTAALGHINENHLLAMVGLLLADELTDLKKAQAAPAPAAADSLNEKDLQKLDEELAKHLNSLNESIKSVALNLKSV